MVFFCVPTPLIFVGNKKGSMDKKINNIEIFQTS